MNLGSPSILFGVDEKLTSNYECGQHSPHCIRSGRSMRRCVGMVAQAKRNEPDQSGFGRFSSLDPTMNLRVELNV